MTATTVDRHSSAFSWWLRTGKLPSVLGPDGRELKFNPWHDPANGRFTFVGAGHHYGAGGGNGDDAVSSRSSIRGGQAPALADHASLQTAALSNVGMLRDGLPTGNGRRSVKHGSPTAERKRINGTRRGHRPDRVIEFAAGFGEGLSDVGKETVTGVHAALTTNPVTTINNAGRAVAGMIDAAIAAEDTPARHQVSRAARAIANASARDIGRATGTVAGNAALAAAPGAAVSKVAALRQLRVARPRPTFDPPRIGWVKETSKSGRPWKAYNDAAPGARPGQAPTLMRTMADGSKRPVKFDGIQGDYVVDRKWKVVNAPHARAQIVRQSQVLAEHRLIGLWEVPTPVQKTKALKLLKQMNITNIHVKVMKP